MKKIYFACSIAGGREHANVYQDIVSCINANGGKVLSELFADPNLVSEIGTDTQITPHLIWERDCKWVYEAKAIIAEVTQPSLGVGYELGLAQMLKKPVLALFYKNSGRRLSPMISGNPHITVFEYANTPEITGFVTDFITTL